MFYQACKSQKNRHKYNKINEIKRKVSCFKDGIIELLINIRIKFSWILKPFGPVLILKLLRTTMSTVYSFLKKNIESVDAIINKFCASINKLWKYLNFWGYWWNWWKSVIFNCRVLMDVDLIKLYCMVL